MKKLSVYFLLIFIYILSSGIPITAQDFDRMLISEDYSYNYDGVSIPVPKSYVINNTILLDHYNSRAVDLCIYSHDKIAVLFSDPAFIVIFDSKYNEIAKISKFYVDGKESTFGKPEGIFADNDHIYVSDTTNNRIIKFDSSLNASKIITSPSKQEINSELPFEPQKIAVDDIGDMFVISRNQTNGIMQFDINGKFTGFLGATKVVPNLVELFWRSISTKEQRANSLKIIPTEYSNLCIDKNGFVYPIVSAVDTYEMYAAVIGRSPGNTPPVRKLNSLGNDILIREGSHAPMGDLEFNLSGKGSGASRFIDICISNDGIYSLLDINRNKVFGYDQRGNLMYIFGSDGDNNEQFKKPIAIESFGEYLVVIDEVKKQLMVFKPTNYQNLLKNAISGIATRKSGINEWTNILKENPYNEIANFEIGKILLSQNKYDDAMVKFKLSHNKEYYSKALKLKNKATGINNANKIFGVILGIIAVFILIFIFRKKIKQKLLQNDKIHKHTVKYQKSINEILYIKHLAMHPFDGFWDIKRENRGSVKTATFILSFSIITNCLYRYTTPYLFQTDKFETSNPLLLGVIQIVIPLLFWCIANWCVTSLFDGNGNFKDIYIYTCYSLFLLPLAFLVMTLMGQIITLDQQPLYLVILPLTLMISMFMLYAGTVSVHEYTPGKALGAISLILLSIGVMVFILILIITLSQQIFVFLNECVKEISLRFQ